MKAHAVFRIGRDIDVRSLPNGDPVANLALATDVLVKGEKHTVWVEAAFFGKRVSSLAPYLTKGTQIMADLEGLHMETFQGNDGPKTKLKARITDITLVGGRKDEQGSAPAPRPAPAPAPAPRPAPAFDVDSDEIPF